MRYEYDNINTERYVWSMSVYYRHILSPMDP